MPLPTARSAALVALFTLSTTAQAATPEAKTSQWLSPLLKQHPLVGQIYDTASHTAVSYRQLLSELMAADFILIGEKHDNPDHHLLEQRLASDLLLAKRRRSLVLEMISSGDHLTPPQLELSATASDKELKTTLNWPENSWKWTNYAPLARLAAETATPVIAGNIDKEMMMTVYKNGISNHASPRLSTAELVSSSILAKIQTQVHEEHCRMMPIARMKPMADIQVARDASMAYSMAIQPPSILVAGAYHVLRKQGVPLHLEALRPGSTVKTVILAEVSNQTTQMTDYPFSDSTDYIWFTPRFTDRNYCDDLEKH